MSKTDRRVRRKKNRAQSFSASAKTASPPLGGYDLGKVELTDLQSVELDTSENTMTVCLQLPVHGGQAYAEYEEVIDFDDGAPGYLIDAARRMTSAALQAVRERIMAQGKLPCETCTGACCGIRFTSVRVTTADIEVLQAAGIDTKTTVTLFEDGADFGGHVGELTLDEGEDGETRCPFLEPYGCGIYEHRPRICREFSPWTCDMMEEDPDKVSGAVQLGRKPVE